MNHMILKYPGSKWRIARKIISCFPEHRSYVEPFFGSGAVLFNKLPSAIETVNDLDDRIVLLFQMVRETPEELAQLINDTPFSRVEYERTFSSKPKTEKEIVRQFLIQCWQGYGFRIDIQSGWKNDVQGREAAYALSNWNRLPEWILEAGKRLKQVQITHEPAIDLLERFRYPNVLIYADPPYVLSTRAGRQYAHEMTDDEHMALIDTLKLHPGPVLLSGYRNKLYDEALKDWHAINIETTSERGLPRTETLWCNFTPYEQISMFD